MKAYRRLFSLLATFAIFAFFGCEDTVTTVYRPLPEPETPPASAFVPPEEPGAVPATGIAIVLPDEVPFMVTGQSLQLAATITPDNAGNKNVGWSSQNSQIIGISGSGLVTAIKTGTATIAAFSRAVPTVRATAAIPVIKPAATFVESVTVRNELSVKAGFPAVVNAAVIPSSVAADTLIARWESSDTAVATVAGSGLSATITAKTQGQADIAVTVLQSDGTADPLAKVTDFCKWLY